MAITRRVVLALSAVTLAGCAGYTPRPTAPHTAAAARASGPLAARLLPPWHQTLNFVLSEPAYVTIFEIVPGRGVSVVYPAALDPSARQSLGPGSHAVFAVPYNVGRWFYSNAPLAAPGPTYLYMIASREPLRIDEVLKNPASLRRTVGFASFRQSNEQRTMDALDARFVPRFLDDDAWTSDWIALWPEPALDRPPVDARLLFPTCGDGMVPVAVPGPTPGYVCAPRNTKQPPTTHEPTPGDSSAQPPSSPPTDAKPQPPRPADGKRPPAPKQTRIEPMSLAVDYGAPATLSPDAARAPRERTAHRSERPWERRSGGTSERDAYPGSRRYDGEYAPDARRRSMERREDGGRSDPSPRGEEGRRRDGGGTEAGRRRDGAGTEPASSPRGPTGAR